MLRKLTLLACLALATANGLLARVHIIPAPVSVRTVNQKPFAFNRHTAIVAADTALEGIARYFREYLERYYKVTLTAGGAAQQDNAIRLELEAAGGAKAKEAYRLESGPKGVLIRGRSEAGVFYGVQTLIQLLPLPDTGSNIRDYRLPVKAIAIPAVSVDDYPRFAYRGMHLDVARHFFPVSFVKAYLDYLALHKMNYFHWHLTDDQGWRIEIKKYPRLTSVGGYRNGTIIGHHPGTASDNTPYGGFYTQDEIREVVAYAATRYITVIPEIELPGHASAAIAAYPQLSCFPDSATVMTGPVSRAGDQAAHKKVQETWGVFEDVFCPSEYTFAFLQDVLDEVVPLFTSPYIHIGGDECPKDAWKRSAFCQDLIRREGLKDEHGLQSYFVRRIEAYLEKKGRRIIGWNEILEGGLAPGATVMSWQGAEGGIAAARMGHDVIMTPGSHVYFDHSQTKNDDSLTIGGYTTIQKVYGFEPVPASLAANQKRYILGAQANLWTEYITSPGKVEYQVFPRMSALSEVLWSPPAGRSWSGFYPRLLTQLQRYRLWRVAYSRALFNPANK